ncbi:DUF3775 domain-containing protein [Arenibaculum sp.]|uniref:DUF3775 domain-containing protein n=1 Tax=Arenibaculum sp. TaxID=2865862 RepID=UPI002E145623|nr:DUF3775 domain-containing protein [Arenibaculum sp.]
MLDQLSVEEVKRVADLAARALAVRDRLVNKLYDVDLGDQSRERDRNPTDLDSLRILDSVGNADYAALKDHIASLSTEQRDELKAVMLIGRGDYAAERWDDAIAAARAVPDGDVEYVAEKAPLHDYLMKGLYELKLG